MSDRLRLADILGGLSIVSDLGYGLPPEEAMRACLIGTGLARTMGLAEPEVAVTFYTALLFHVGCSTFSHELSQIHDDEVATNTVAAKIDFSDPRDILKTFIPESTRGMQPIARLRAGAVIVTRGKNIGKRFDTSNCEVARETARRVGLPEPVQRALYEIHEWWNGRGVPLGLKGEEIGIAARVARLATDAAVLMRVAGLDSGIDVLRRRAGRTLDPSLVAAFAKNASTLMKEAEAGDPKRRILEVEPEPPFAIGENDLPELAAAFADLADLKTPYTHGHSREVARLAVAAAERMGAQKPAIAQLGIAALLHDLGRVGISDGIWEKPGPLTTAEWEQVRMHAYHSERILATSETLQPLSRLVGLHHERLDGSGYHRGSTARDLSVSARVLAAVDAFQAMTQQRPHRPARSLEQAAEVLASEARAGRLDADVVAAVVEAAGQPRGRRAGARPSGLSDREVEVLRLIAEGLSNPAIAKRLYISRRTAEHHVQNIYAKIGVSSRAAATLFALEQDLLLLAE
jgi:HD-GYP domain-containing protein (c-di-GMP phosphodiesterase class II)